jgi:thiosulfate/3-mercaptopyruvate sulfurtransferase
MIGGCANLHWAVIGAGQRTPRARTEMLVTTPWLSGNLANPNVVVLHVARNRQGYDAGHIPGARLLLWADFATTRAGIPNELPPLENLVSLVRRLGIAANSRVIAYDEDAGLEAARAYVTFDYLGMGGRTALLNGQWKKWKAEGRAVSTIAPVVKISTFTPHAHPEIIVSFAEMRRLVEAKAKSPNMNLAIIDARPEGQYEGKEAGEGVKRAGHIPGAANVCWVGNVVNEENPVMRPVHDLRATYEQGGAKPGVRVVTHCRTGVMASHDYFTAKYLGYDVRLYDGSYYEWSASKDTAVETGKK